MAYIRKSYGLLVRGIHSNTAALPNPNNTRLKPFESIPGPYPLPLIGNMWRYMPIIGHYDINDLNDLARQNNKRYGPIVRFKINKKLTILSLFDPKDVEDLFRQDDRYPSRRAFIGLKKYRIERPDKYPDGGIVPENGPNWQKHRSLFQDRMLSKSRVAAYASKIDKETLKTINELIDLTDNENGKQILSMNTFKKVLNNWSLGCMTSLFLDCELDTIPQDQRKRLLEEIDNTLIATHGTDLLSTRWMTEPDKCKYYQLLVKSQDFLTQFADERVERVIKDGDKKRGSMVHDWLYEDKVPRKYVNSFVMDSFQAGVHTTSYTLAHLFYHLNQNQEHQNLIHEEIDKNMIHEKDTLQADDVDPLVYLQYCLQETLRMNPISTGTGRLTTSDISLAGYHIPKGTMIIVENEVISRDAKNFSNPDLFQPTRWRDYRSCPRHERPSPFACRPFGLGARACIGQRIIELEMRIFIARLLQHFRIESFSKPETITYMLHILKNDLNVKLSRRNASKTTTQY